MYTHTHAHTYTHTLTPIHSWQEQHSKTSPVSPPTAQPTGDFIILTHNPWPEMQRNFMPSLWAGNQFYPSIQKYCRYWQLLHNCRMAQAFLSQEAPRASLIVSLTRAVGFKLAQRMRQLEVPQPTEENVWYQKFLLRTSNKFPRRKGSIGMPSKTTAQTRVFSTK